MKVILNLLCYSITYSQKLWGLIRQHDEAKVIQENVFLV